MAFVRCLDNILGIRSCQEASTVDHKVERLDLGLDLVDLEDPDLEGQEDPDMEDPEDPNTEDPEGQGMKDPEDPDKGDPEDPVVRKNLEDLIPVGLVDPLTKACRLEVAAPVQDKEVGQLDVASKLHL